MVFVPFYSPLAPPPSPPLALQDPSSQYYGVPNPMSKIHLVFHVIGWHFSQDPINAFHNSMSKFTFRNFLFRKFLQNA